MFKKLKTWLCRLFSECKFVPTPNPPTLSIEGEYMIQGIKLRVYFPNKTSADHANWGVRIDYGYKSGDEVKGPFTLEMDDYSTDLAFADFVVPKDASGVVKLRAIDVSGNKSPYNSGTEFIASDTFPPPVPGQFSLETIEEVEMDEPTV